MFNGSQGASLTAGRQELCELAQGSRRRAFGEKRGSQRANGAIGNRDMAG
jgi:hypothetical protein